MDRRTFLVGLGSVAVGSGAVLESSAVTAVDANRSTGVRTAADANALLGLGGVDDASTTPTFTNNAAGSMTVTLSSKDPNVVFDVVNDGSSPEPSVGFTLGLDTTKQVRIDGDGSAAPVTVDATIKSDGDSVIGSVSLQRSYALSTAYRVPSGQTQNGDVETNSDVIVEENGQITGSLESGGSVTVEQGGQINGEVEANGDVSLGQDAQINKSVETDGSVTLGQDAQINKSVETDGSVTLGQDAQINGEIQAGGSVTVGQNAQVNSSVEATGDVTLEQNAQINGDVETDGTVYLGCNAQVNGTIDAANTVDTC